jgi:DNA-binding CsgD family transcriptional regulator
VRKNVVPNHLSPRQLEVLQGIVDGKALKEIGDELHVCSKTIEYHQAMLKEALQIRTTAILVQFALHHNLSHPALLPDWPTELSITARRAAKGWLPFKPARN